jgi:protein phosphatase
MPEIEFFELSEARGPGGESQDAVGHWPHEDGLVFAVADGVGANAGARVASMLALQTLAREIAAAPLAWPLVTRLRRAFQAANLEIYQKGITVPELACMGTTLTATALVGGSLVTAHVGDCRLSLLRRGDLVQLTKDHTWAWDAAYSGVLHPEEIHAHPRRHELSRHLGQELIVPVDLLSMDLQAGDVFVHSSNGIHTALDAAEITELLEGHPPEAACRALVRRGREMDAHNLSVQVARVGDLDPPAGRRWWQLGR